MSNPRIEQLQLYPFERLNALKAPLTTRSNTPHVPLSIGEPKHAPPDFVLERLTDREQLAADLSTYPATRGSDDLRESIATWLNRRFGVRCNPGAEILPVAGTREALFSFAQAQVSQASKRAVMMPNPFYQIYEGAALLAGAEPLFIPSDPERGYAPNFDHIDEQTWQRTEVVYICSPGNPTGYVWSAQELGWLIELAHRHDFVIAADECYSEIYFDESHPPAGLLEASQAIGNTGYARCVVFHSLSKRSNLPGLRSGFVAGDADVLARYYQYRTYEGCALPAHTQAASVLAWADEHHVIENRTSYRAKFEATRKAAPGIAPPKDPGGGFYWWLATPIDDQSFAAALFEEEHITVLPGSFLGRATDGLPNPGANHVRVAWVASIEQCVDAATRLDAFVARLSTA